MKKSERPRAPKAHALERRGGTPKARAKQRLSYAVRVRKNPEGTIVAQDLGPKGEGYPSAGEARRIAQAAADAGVGPQNKVYLERVRISRAAQKRARDTLESGLFQPVNTGPKRPGAVSNPGGGTVESLGFRKSLFTRSAARTWAKAHGYRWVDRDVDETDAFLWMRQKDPGQFDRIRTITLTTGVEARIGYGKARSNVRKNPDGKWRKIKTQTRVHGQSGAGAGFQFLCYVNGHTYWVHEALDGWRLVRDPSASGGYGGNSVVLGTYPTAAAAKAALPQANPNAAQHRKSAAKMASRVASAPDEATRRYFEGALAAHAGVPQANPGFAGWVVAYQLPGTAWLVDSRHGTSSAAVAAARRLRQHYPDATIYYEQRDSRNAPVGRRYAA